MRINVSIPFIAGQWSLRKGLAATSDEEVRFNPLHCGAVVASRRPPRRHRRGGRVSIPFIAGQWSLPGRIVDLLPRGTRVSIPFIAGQWSLPARAAAAGARDDAFQSPSLRGSGRFVPAPGAGPLGGPGFNPLHCGAVVASRGGRRGAGAPRRRVSIPFIAGQWSLRVGQDGRIDLLVDVSIPFIAGQWSLRDVNHPGPHLRHPVSIPFIAGQWSLQATGYEVRLEPLVSIPFIAGQWSLRPARRSRRRRRSRVSIPFIAGQWSLRAKEEAKQ